MIVGMPTFQANFIKVKYTNNMTKVIITLEGGIITSVCANKLLDITVVDYDLIDNGESPVFKLEQDEIFKNGEAYQLIDNALGPAEQEVRDELKRMKI